LYYTSAGGRALIPEHAFGWLRFFRFGTSGLQELLAHVVGLSEHKHQFQLHKAPMNVV
jgi:hypothetical protein